jgi:hypothetical protein
MSCLPVARVIAATKDDRLPAVVSSTVIPSCWTTNSSSSNRTGDVGKREEDDVEDVEDDTDDDDDEDNDEDIDDDDG